MTIILLSIAVCESFSYITTKQSSAELPALDLIHKNAGSISQAYWKTYNNSVVTI